MSSSNFLNRAVCEIMWKKKVLLLHSPQMRIWRMRIACWVPKAINTHSEYVILISFPLQRLLQERVKVSCYTCSACLAVSIYCEVRAE